MKPALDRLAVVTATINPVRAMPCFASWDARASCDLSNVVVWNGALDTSGMTDSDRRLYEAWSPTVDHRRGNGTCLVRPEILGVVPAFAIGVAAALQQGAEIICCLHDDVLIEQDGWDLAVVEHFDRHPACGLAGFGGGTGLGHADIYRKGYSPYDLAREGFASNMRGAEAHGRRETRAIKVACLDGFSQIGRREFWQGWKETPVRAQVVRGSNLFQQMTDWGIVHHAYDAATGAFARRLGWEAWMLPIACDHLGGQTAVGEARYATWAEGVVPGGDRAFWELAHKEVYERFRDVLPIRV